MKVTFLSRPLMFLEEYFPYWKDRIDMYIKPTQYRLIVKGVMTPFL